MEVGCISLCVIGRRENPYAVEYVEHYRTIGFDKIFIYDNNFGDEERFEEVLDGYIGNGFVEIVNWRDKVNMQKEAYEDCYRKHGNEYAWMAFFDFDEFLVIKDGSDIHDFMKRADGFGCMLVNWMVMTDNNLVRYEDKPVMERFTQPMPYGKCCSYGTRPENFHVKSIVRGGISGLVFRNAHRPQTKVACCNARGVACARKTFLPYDYTSAYLKHFTTKTIEEWLKYKVERGYPDGNTEDLRKNAIAKFFQRNEVTEEKISYIMKNIKGKVAAMALGRMGNQMFCAVAAATYARRTGREFVGLVLEEDAHYDFKYPKGLFETVMRNVKYMRESDCTDFYKQEHGQYLCNGFPTILESNVILNDFYQDARCIDRDIALEMFRPYDSILNEISDLYGDLSDYVCVNVRRGDYLKHTRKGFRVLSKKDIEDILAEHFPNDKVFFISDDIDWCKENFKGERYLFADKPCRYKPEMDLYLQTRGKGNVIANSSFSWWGAFLNENGGKVVCPWPWFTEGMINPMEHILPEGWIRWTPKIDYKIWITYHKDELVQEYGLKEDEHHKLFAVHKDIEGENINRLNPIYSEIVTMYYIWKNQVKSDYVGFNHYRRQFEQIKIPKENECQVYKMKLKRMTIYDQYAKWHNHKDLDLILDIVDRQYGRYNAYSQSIRYGNRLLPCCCFLMSWDNFNCLCEFLFPILFEFARITGCNDDIEKWREKAIADFNGEDTEYQMRIQGFLAERLISAWILCSLKYYK